MKIAVVRKKTLRNIFAAVVALTLLLSAAASVGYSAVSAGAGRRIPVYNVDTDRHVVSLTFDAAWGADKTKGILDILDDYGVKATFFLVGFWVDNFPEMVKEIDAHGHEIGTHSETHPHMPTLSKEKIKDELSVSSGKITDITGKAVSLFRPPFGDYNNALVESCEEMQIIPVQWDVDSLDWKGLSAAAIHQRVVGKVKDGSIVLFHNNSDNILEALPLVIETLRLKKFTFAPVGDVVYKTDYYVDNNGTQHKKDIQ